MDTETQVHSANTLRQPVEEKENSEFKPGKLRLKIDLVSNPDREIKRRKNN